MTAYAVALLVHSYLRWIVLLLGAALLARCLGGRRAGRAWSRRDDLAGKTWIAALDTQVLVGLLLYTALSPISAAAFGDMKLAMKDATLRFFSVEHVFAMGLGLVVAHVGWARAKRREAGARHRAVAITVGLWLVAVVVGIPWPGLPYARPLARRIEGAPAGAEHAVAAPPVYAKRCAACHGEAGGGDGPAALGLRPQPRSFQDAAWQRNTTDEQIRAVIVHGGSARGLSASMPPNGDLTPGEVDGLVAYLRSLAAAPR